MHGPVTAVQTAQRRKVSTPVQAWLKVIHLYAVKLQAHPLRDFEF
jgi:hypothetical protein